MVAYEVPATQTKYSSAAGATVTYSQGASAAVSCAVRPVQNWRRHGGGGGGVVGNPFSARPSSMQQVLQVPPTLVAPKPEPELYGNVGDDEGAESEYYLHGRKRSKLHDSLPAATIQHSLARKMTRMLPPMPISVPSAPPCHPLEEPSPLGLTLKKTPSLLDLITLQLAHSRSESDPPSCESSDQGLCKSGRVEKCSAPGGSAAQDKLKASNFPASTLKIGTWERVSRYEGDLVAKCYYAKRKLVWEVLDSGLKSKIEIQWSDISAMKATCPDSLPGSLEIEVSRPPLFFKETNPQPRKHTLWQATSDFTGGQATTFKRHSLQFPEGVLNKHYEKLVQCDPHLKALLEGTAVSGSIPLCGHTDSIFEEQSALHLSSPLTHALEGLNYQPQPPSCPYSPLQGRCRRTGVIPKTEADSMDMHMSDISSPSSVAEIRRSEGGISECDNSDSEDYDTKKEFTSSTPFGTVNPAYSSAMSYDEHELKPSLNDLSGSNNVTASNRIILDEIAQMLLGDSSATFSNEQAILLAARMSSMQAALARDFQTGPGSHPQTEGFVSDVHYGYCNINSGQDSGADYCQADFGPEDFIGRTNEQHSSPRLPKFNAMLDPSFNSVMQCLSRNSSTGQSETLLSVHIGTYCGQLLQVFTNATLSFSLFKDLVLLRSQCNL
ncbi:hypothetical protein BDL97_04G128700 [Sphagnum fallax]|nr:hypothetical protein BDL97_04G128700 [Sphagnum fallax]